MAEHLLDVLQVGPGRVGESRGAVAEVVEPDRREADLLVQLDEPPGDVGGVEHLAVLLGEDAAGLHPSAAPLLAVLVLLGAVPLEGLDRVGVERDGACAGVGLGVVLVHLPAVHDELLGDGDETSIQVTTPLVIELLSPLLSGGYAGSLAASVHTAGGGFTFVGVVLPCAAGILVRLALPASLRGRALGAVVPAALAGSLVLTYVNASGALGSFVARPRPLLLGAALVVAALVCLLSFVLGRCAARLLRLDPPAACSLTLACGMNNSGAGAVLITAVLPDKPHLLLPVLAYGLLQKTAANRVVRVGPSTVLRSIA